MVSDATMEGNTMGRLIATPRLVRARLRQAEATMLRASGWSYTAIATHLGYSCRASAFKAVKRTLDVTRDRAGLVHRLMFRIRLERGLERFASAVEAGDYGSALRTLDRVLPEVE
jgi:hypothetical protein